MQSKLQAAINQLCAEKNLEKDIVVGAIENAIAIAYKKDFGRPGQKIVVNLGDDIADMRIFEERTVTPKVEDVDLDILLKDAKTVRPDAKVGEIVFVPVPPHESFGRIAAQTAKHVIAQKLQEAERSMLFTKFKDREGELLNARVQKIEQNVVLLEIDGVSTMLFRNQQIPHEKYFNGQRLRVLLEKVELTSKGPQLRITRSNPEFIIACFESEIPEMREGLVRVAKIVREPGVRCKIAVISDDPSVDPVGAFVGQKGSRINVVMDEVGDERLDIIQFHEDPKKLLLAALSPAKVAKVEFVKEKDGQDRAKIHVREEERAVAIGKNGQNVRLAGELIGMQIDVKTFTGPDEEDESLAKPARKEKAKKEISENLTIDKLAGLDEATINTLKEFGLTQIKQFEGLKPEEVAEIGVDLKQAKTIVKAVEDFMKN